MPTSVRLDDKTEAILRRLATKSGKSKSAIIREAIERYEKEVGETPSSVYDDVSDLIGIGSDGDPELAVRSEEILKARFSNSGQQS